MVKVVEGDGSNALLSRLVARDADAGYSHHAMVTVVGRMVSKYTSQARLLGVTGKPSTSA